MSAIALVGNMIAPGGGPASGCKLNSYLRNTTTRSPLYSDVGLATPTTNPYVADADGRLEFYFSSLIEYTWRVTTADGATVIWEADIVGGVVTVTYTDGVLIHATWAPALANSLGANWAGAFNLPMVTPQPLDADLTAVAGLATTGLIERTGAGTSATRTLHESQRAILAADRLGPPLLDELWRGSGANALFGLNYDLDAASATRYEVGAQFSILSSVGYANRATAAKVALFAAALGDPGGGSADIYGFNVIGAGPAGAGGILVTGLEINCQNNSSNNADTVGATTAANGLVITSGSNGRSTSGIWITATDNVFNHGVTVGSAHLTCFNIEATVVSTYLLRGMGTHTTGLDLSGSALSNSAVLPNNAPILFQDTGATARNAINLNASNIYELGYTGAPISVLSTAAASSSTSGALRVAGGVGIAGDAYVGGAIVGSSTITAAGVITSSVDGATGASPLVAHNTNEANNTTKYVQALLKGEDTIGTIKDVGAVRASPVDSNWSDSYTGMYARVSDVLTEVFRARGAYAEFLSPARMRSYTVGTLPTGGAGDMAYASDGRKAGEGGGAGTGVIVFNDGSAWKAVDTGATAAA